MGSKLGRCAIALACCLPVVGGAQGLPGFEADYDDEKKAWKEIEAQIPPYPKPENLLLFETAPAGHQFFVDAQSISVGSDGVVRYTLLMKTAGGAVNVSYEGIRCETREQKYYAIGQPGGAWTRARNPAWRYIEPKEYNRYHGILHGDYFCVGKTTVADVRAVLDALKYGSRHPRYHIRN